MEIQQILDSQAIAGFDVKPRPIEVEAFSAVLARKMESDLDETVQPPRPAADIFQPGSIQTMHDRPADRHPSRVVSGMSDARDQSSDATSADAAHFAYNGKQAGGEEGRAATKSGSSEPEQTAGNQGRPAADEQEKASAEGASPIQSAASSKAENAAVRASAHVVAGEAALPSPPGAANQEAAPTVQPGMVGPEAKAGSREMPASAPMATEAAVEPSLPVAPSDGELQQDGEIAQARAVAVNEASKLTLIAADLIQDRPLALPAGQGALLPTTGANTSATATPNALPEVLAPEAPDMIPAAAKVVLAQGQADLPAKAAKAEAQPRPGPKPQVPSHTRDAAPASVADHAAIAARAATPAGPGVSTVPAEARGWNGSGPFESMDSATLPGWSVHLTQGAPAKRQEFLASLKQHLQDLPTHEQISVQMQRALRDGAGRITIQLHPAELGRIHVRMEIDEEKRVAASISAERPTTLDLLQRDARLLERALQEAGLKLDANGMSFSLAREQAEKGSDDAGTYRGPTGSHGEHLEPEAEPGLMDMASGLLNLRV